MTCFTALLAPSTLFWPAFTPAYSLKDDYTSNGYQDFFSKFSFWTSNGPNGGLADDVDEGVAWANGLIGNGGNIYLGSVRLTGNIAYNSGTLVVSDIAYMPQVCGTWPAFWMTAASDDWPQSGEIDIVEQANNAQNNQMSLHVGNKQGQYIINCTKEANGGCDANDPRTNSFGSGFNNNGGGVYVMEWNSEWVRIWFFPRNEIPSGDNGPLGSSPDPSAWGAPTTSFHSRHGTDCDMSAHIWNQRIVIDTTFCGTWATGTWSSSRCAFSTGYSSCEDYVKDVPAEFKYAFWTFRSVKAFT
ncbi:concanavalin A-like lectin/glucanase domain-containing protein [Aspergillus leporis]|uniref:Concanavalin A-like lectin/glucanase domain-containing protein n=1 Tax=Aspergillus leporis TaxID=41062 RepID=A0A5N5WIV4_9EURO|nr:concanavalin A-like lectin/glucanase domain-containing protein [Aspergillus leporis]